MFAKNPALADGGDDVLDLEENRHEVASEVTNYTYQKGRCYNIKPDGIEDEFEEADMGQNIYGLLYKRQLFQSPTDSPNRVLDVGAGSGKWAMDMGMYPDATVTGVDLSLIQPSWTPENVKFDIDDVNEEWNYEEKFDLIHVQGMAGMIKDWAYLSGQAMKIQDSLEHAGFLDIQQKMFYVPTNTWPMDQEISELGKFRNLHYMEAIQGSIGFSMKVMKYNQDDALSFTESVQAEVNNRRIHAYDAVCVFTARKPDNY
ncbi:S-adenosyl-L-methionine-dependent methyltransferase [Penicillium malachiteum]|uniref:S-adenosyl-L-methionine-dependent methyltransferase n=1 Tax=Penicillium malachiteum TaxID=1324776 RepID=A0AAD6MZQ7_9EURO|nr:S-adenosyl-L-methionine-dependent methyltransferase [Penicillium malachiteum]